MEWYRLRCVGLSDSKINLLLKLTKDYFEIFKLDREQLIKYLKFSQDDLEKLNKSKDIDLDKELNYLNEKKIKLLFIHDEDYSVSLKNISQPPIFLYYKGDVKILSTFIIGVVGTRNATRYGKIACEKFTTGLIDAGITTVSGVALGIDTVCHTKTLEKKGVTIGVVGSGLDIIYPKENKWLWEEIPKTGVLISEFPLGTEPMPYNFPQRNRIIVGLSKGILIVESKEKGGSLISAEIALEEGRDIFAIPGEIFSMFSVGCNQLIKNSQAKLVTKVEDILDDYGIKINKEVPKLSLKLSDLETKVYEALNTTKNLDEIILTVKMKAPDVLSILMDLEMKKLILSVSGGCYRKNPL
ncbi:MAG: DNA-processing protein DprA [Fusobacteriaceae bacterium]